MGETSAAATRPETVNRVDPPRTLPAAFALPEEERRDRPSPPPDPEAPAGPPPAFDATPLERERERLRAPADLVPTGPEDARPAAGRTDGVAEDRAPRSASDAEALGKAEAEVAELRRMAAPAAGRSVDVVL